MIPDGQEWGKRVVN